MVDFIQKSCYNTDDLRAIMELLRSEQGCPWDREQTHQSIRRNFIEEAYEAVEAIDEEDAEHLKEELGDVLLQVVFTPVWKKKRAFSIWTTLPTESAKSLSFAIPIFSAT